MDRSELGRALAKAVAYIQCGKRDTAKEYVIALVKLLGMANILATEYR